MSTFGLRHALAFSALWFAFTVAADEPPGKRLSNILIDNGVTFPALQGDVQWFRGVNKAPQLAEKNALLQVIAEQHRFHRESAAISSFAKWWVNQPVTGAEALPESDPRVLMLHPELDPVMQQGDAIRINPIASAVAILGANGAPCDVMYLPRATVRDYLQACAISWHRDSIQVINPGQYPRSVSVDVWSAQDEALVMPGAMLWLPLPRLSEADQRALVTHIATLGSFQGVSTRVPGLMEPVAQQLRPTSSDWGSVGLLQMPTARFREAGSASASLSVVDPYVRYSFMLQPFDWLEGGFRYTDVRNRAYGPADFSGDQTYKDKSIDVKFRLLEEGVRQPQLALGLRDLGGTGFFSSEFLVASKRYERMDFTLGLGWGNLASRGTLSNPLSFLLSSRFDDRPPGFVAGQAGGTSNSSSYFRGPTNLFGGLEWHAINQPLTLKLEYDANSYQNEILGNRFDVSLPLNFGAVYRFGKYVEVQAALERGNTLSFGVTVHDNLSKLKAAKTNDAPTLAISHQRPSKQQATWPAIAQAIQYQTGSEVLQISKSRDEVKVVMSQPNAAYGAAQFERAGRVLHAATDDTVNWFDFNIHNTGLAVSTVTVNREALALKASNWTPPKEREQVLTVEPPLAESPADEVVYRGAASPRGYTLGLDYNQIIGGPDGFLLFQIDALATGRINLDANTWGYGAARLRLFDTYDNFMFDGPSGLPRVRTDVRRYLTESPVQLTNLQLSHTVDLGSDMFAMFYGGYLERMFAGFGAEWLLRPQGSPLAIGVDINRVKQRDFDEGFGLRDYLVTTGHVSLYMDTGYQDILAVVKAGKYLAGDFGLTFDVSRIFRNGVTMGAYATLTSASEAEYGEGSFSKGIYVSVPFDALLENSSRSATTLNWSPLTRDGGALLSRAFSLYGMTDLRQQRTMGLMQPR